MNTANLSVWCARSAIPFILAIAPVAKAHDYASFIAIQPNAQAVLTASCFDDGNGTPDRLDLSIRNATKSNYLLTATVVTGDIKGSTTDTISGDRLPSKLIGVKGGAATYTVTVSKTKKKPTSKPATLKGRATFQIVYHCQSTNNQHTGTNEFYRSK